MVRVGSLRVSGRQEMSLGEHMTHIDCLFTVQTPKRIMRFFSWKTICNIIPYVRKTLCSLRDEKSVIPVILEVFDSVR